MHDATSLRTLTNDEWTHSSRAHWAASTTSSAWVGRQRRRWRQDGGQTSRWVCLKEAGTLRALRCKHVIMGPARCERDAYALVSPLHPPIPSLVWTDVVTQELARPWMIRRKAQSNCEEAEWVKNCRCYNRAVVRRGYDWYYRFNEVIALDKRR